MNEHWRGTFTALVTPFRHDGSLDVPALERLVRLQCEGGVDGLVPCGTTGESAALEDGEKLRVIETVRKASDGRLLVIAGAGGNSTGAVARLAREAEAAGADALLSVVPYYNRPNQEGLYRHFATVAEAVQIPVFLYNVPSRTGTNLEPSTVARLAAHGNVRGIKEASGNLSRVNAILEQRPEGFRVLSGEDELTLPLIALGGDGVISVVSNEVPMLMSTMVRQALAGRFLEARSLHFRMLPLMRANFVDTNPIPVKAALAMMGFMEAHLRLPLTPLGDAARGSIEHALASMELLETGRASERH